MEETTKLKKIDELEVAEDALCPICNKPLTMPVNLYNQQKRRHKRRAGYCGNCGRVFSNKEIIAGSVWAQ